MFINITKNIKIKNLNFLNDILFFTESPKLLIDFDDSELKTKILSNNLCTIECMQ